ncbi:MAG TPA: TROVE domain-containing protein [Desulfatiglandales bacterium]|nr:TROVE domain-containing protein [Desulfatiglandales bacterium]
MSKLNVKAKREVVRTHEGAETYRVKAVEDLRRAVMSCMLWEDTFYQTGSSIAKRIAELVPQVKPEEAYQIAVDARNKSKLRHVPLFIARQMALVPGMKGLLGKLLPEIIQRPDELTEFLSIYWMEKRQPLSGQVKKGLAKAFKKFNEYSLAKYNQDSKVKLRDVLFLTHPKANDASQQDMWNRLIKGELKTPDTWEVELSKNGNSKEAWERLLAEKKLGGLALIRNLRNMTDKGVDPALVNKALDEMDGSRILPFRFLAATKHAPKFEPGIEKAFLKSMEGREKLPGKTVFVVDISGSMASPLSSKSTMTRMEAASSLAVLVRELCEEPVIYATAGNDHNRVHATALVPSRRGFALSDAVVKMESKLGGGGIFLKQVCDYVKGKEKTADRLIVITDEQDCSNTHEDAPANADAFGKMNYIINVNTYEHGIAYDNKWIHISSWSEAVLDYIREYERSTLTQ